MGSSYLTIGEDFEITCNRNYNEIELTNQVGFPWAVSLWLKSFYHFEVFITVFENRFKYSINFYSGVSQILETSEINIATTTNEIELYDKVTVKALRTNEVCLTKYNYFNCIFKLFPINETIVYML